MNDLTAKVHASSAFQAIAEDQIDLWSVDLDSGEYREEEAYALLSPVERDRAQRFRFPVDRTRYINRRGILRTLLGRYLGVTPQSISLTYGPHGKPVIYGEALHFNQSHSGSRACFAFSSISPVGVDLELVRPMPDLLRVAGGFCSYAELAALKALPAEQQSQAFFRCWTRKEALVKASGEGLSYPLDQFSVSLDEPARLIDLPPGQEELRQWHFHTWEPGLEYVGAVVSRRPDSRIVPHSL